MKFTLPMSDGYVIGWGLWEAVRELWQNALDETADGVCKASLTYDGNLLRIATTRGRLDHSMLVLGNSSKREQNLRGKFGEGFKLSLLVLARLGNPVEVLTGSESWQPKLEHDDTFNSVVLKIYTEPVEEREGVEFIVGDVTESDWDTIRKNIRPQDETFNSILEAPDQMGRIYVGGLYVTTVKGFKCGYAFRAGTINLDRDRGMVSGFDLAWETSKLWTDRGGKRAVELMNEEAPDVEYVESHAAPTSRLALDQASYFSSSYGIHAVPVSSQEEIQRATNAGIKWVLVPEKVKSVLRLLRSFFIPTMASPLDQLKDFRKKYVWNMDRTMAHDLDEIIASMDPAERTKAA
jgi:hypothetical protein